MFPTKFVSLNNGLCCFIRKVLVYNNCLSCRTGRKSCPTMSKTQANRKRRNVPSPIKPLQRYTPKSFQLSPTNPTKVALKDPTILTKCQAKD